MFPLKLYFALSEVGLDRNLPGYIQWGRGRNYLASFVYGEQIFNEWNKVVSRELESEYSLLLDSGAFSAWRSGRVIDIKRYSEFIIQFKEAHSFGQFTPINLDKIPSVPGKAPTQDEVRESGEVGILNAQFINEFTGVPPMEVYHQGEHMDFLYKMAERRENAYIGVSPANDVSASRRAQWLDQVFGIIDRRYGWGLRTHGFGVTSFKLMREYPWFSVDSATYNIAAGFGQVFLFDPNKPGMLHIDCGPNSGSIQSKNFLSIEWDSYLKLMPGCIKEPNDLISALNRRVINMNSFVSANEWINKERFSKKPGNVIQFVFGDTV